MRLPILSVRGLCEIGLVMTVSLVLHGCKTTGAVGTGPIENTSKRFKTVVMNSSYELIQSKDEGRMLAVSLRPIPGALVGKPAQTEVMHVPVRVGDDVVLSMTDLEGAIAPLAQAANAMMHASGLVVMPLETRLLRVGTFFRDDDVPDKEFGAGFLDVARVGGVVLIYFDRPCTIGGDLLDDDHVISFSLTVPRAGLYWMGTDKTNPRHWKATMVDPSTALRYALIR